MFFFFINDQHLSLECFIWHDNEKNQFIWQTTIDEEYPLELQKSWRFSYSVFQSTHTWQAGACCLKVQNAENECISGFILVSVGCRAIIESKMYRELSEDLEFYKSLLAEFYPNGGIEKHILKANNKPPHRKGTETQKMSNMNCSHN